MIMKVDSVKLNNRKLYNKMFFREFDVLHHIKPNDFWVILNRRVLDLSHLVQMIDELPSTNNDLTVRICLFLLKKNVSPQPICICNVCILSRHCISFACSVVRM